VSHVLVTGGASGIGAGTVQYLAGLGVMVSVIDRVGWDDAPWWNELDETVRGHWIIADATQRESYAEALERIGTQSLNGLVTSAGISLKETLFESSEESWGLTWDVNVMGTAIAVKHVASHMLEAGIRGSIVTMASTVSYGAISGLGAHYHASKGAIIALTRALASELGPHGIRVNAVAPGLVKTPLTQFMRDTVGEDTLTQRVPLRDIASPHDVAQAVAFLLSTDSSMVTGQVVPVDGGQLMVAGQPPGGFPPPMVLRR